MVCEGEDADERSALRTAA